PLEIAHAIAVRVEIRLDVETVEDRVLVPEVGDHSILNAVGWLSFRSRARGLELELGLCVAAERAAVERPLGSRRFAVASRDFTRRATRRTSHAAHWE